MGDKKPAKKKAPKNEKTGKNAPAPTKPAAPPDTGPKKKGNK
jgi:hypothetical protein